jgi:scyllo-inositol 2-dehydrogenase (NADP+)
MWWVRHPPLNPKNSQLVLIKINLHINNLNMLNVAIIGFGLSGRYLQAPFFETNPNFNLTTIVSVHQNPKEYYPNVNVAKSIEEVLVDKTIDLVSICSPNETHFAYTKLALHAGKHVLVEKPFTATSKEAEELILLAKAQNKTLTVFQNRRWDSDFLTVKKLIEENRLGEILNFEIHFNRFKPTLNVKKWKEINSESSGVLYDLGAHIIDQAIVLFGAPQNVWGQTFIQREKSEIDDAFYILLDYGKLKVTLRSSLMVREDSPRYIIHGTKGSFVKYGMDVQEDDLKAGKMPNDIGFGEELIAQFGTLYTEKNGMPFAEKMKNEKGNWAMLFQNVYNAIVHSEALLVKLEEVVEQIKIIELVKNKK